MSLDLAEERQLKCLFCLPLLAGWGAERFTLNLLNYLDRKRFKPLLVVSSKRGPLLEEVPCDVPIYELGRGSKVSFPKLILKLAFFIRKERPQLIVSNLFHSNILAILAKHLSGLTVPVVIRQTNSRSEYISEPLQRWLIPWLYPHADLILALSSGVQDDLLRDFKFSLENVQTIHNGVDIAKIRRLAEEDVDPSFRAFCSSPPIVASSRFEKRKGLDYLVRAFSLVREKIPSRLLCVGDGNERTRLEMLVRRLALTQDVLFIGYQKTRLSIGDTLLSLCCPPSTKD
jgi:glycosyltransferase involved in cell wall biosynthesis